MQNTKIDGESYGRCDSEGNKQVGYGRNLLWFGLGKTWLKLDQIGFPDSSDWKTQLLFCPSMMQYDYLL